MLADRIRDYLLICVTASSRTHNATEFTSGHISISNSEDDASSVITVREKRPTPGFLLQIASALTGLNVQIQQGLIQARALGGLVGGSGKCGDESHGLRDGSKLNFEQISSLLFTLNVVLGYHQNPLTPPDSELLASTSGDARPAGQE
ncbi:hypothetical protein QBZ16_001638 [Prototheca wickerhamii]|uniref:Uncharacterized protein n=1 Tax=Prototheca wickerhamii TaxID=3111 RepID=A0AAD9IF78_PROWI|nr:hypothetical protein QBZ16_001638 [Prototheca wickerhamii]